MSKLPKHLKSITDEEEVEIQRQIAADPDDEDLSDEAAKRPMTFAQAIEKSRQRGRPAVASPRQQISIRLDPDLLAHYKAMGKGWQGRLNDDLRKVIRL